jgi:hypothetical protein
VVVGETHTLPRQRVNGGCADFATVAGQVGETQVIGQHQQDIGPLSRLYMVLFNTEC